MDTVDPLIWISLFGLAVAAMGFIGGNLTRRHMNRKYGPE